MKLISWNVNGIRACLEKGFLDTFSALDADFFCLQETKAQPHQVALPMQLEMYTIYTSTLVDSVIQIVFNNGINFHIIQL